MPVRVVRRAAYLFHQRWIQLAFLAAAALAVIALLTAQGYRAVDRSLTEAALSRRQALSYLTAITLSEKFDRLADIAVALATRVRFRQLAAEGKWSQAIEILAEVPLNLPFIERVFVTDPAATLKADAPVLPGAREQNFAARDWYRGVGAKWEPYVSNVYRRAAPPQLNVVAVAVPIRNDRRQVVGILVLQITLDRMFDWVKGIDAGPEGLVYIVDRAGTLASHPSYPAQDELRDFSGAPAVRKVLRGERGVELLRDIHGTGEVLVAYEPVGKYGWGAAIAQPKAEAFAAKNKLLMSGFLAYAMVLVLLIVAAYLIYRIMAERRQGELVVRQNAELERRVSERTAQLEAANKELEGFSYSVSHDLRAPLRAIDGFTRIIGEDCGDRLDTEGKRCLGVIIDNCRKMTQLIDDLLAFSRLGRQPLAASRVDMAQLVRELAAELETPPADDALLVKPMPPVAGDHALLRQVWANLLSNAVKFTARSGAPRIEVGGELANGEAVYYVKDNGAGFNMAYYQKLFGVFQRLHSTDEYPGTGVGLAIVQRIVNRHGGRVWAEGKEGGGATFYFALPAQPG